MQFRKRDKEAIARGELTLTFRRWRRPQAKVGGRHRVGDHLIEIDSVAQIDQSEISLADARAAGHESPTAVLDAIRHSQRPAREEREEREAGGSDAPIYRVEFTCLGEQTDPRSILAADDSLDQDEITQIRSRLERMDSRSRRGPWTQRTLQAIADSPARRAAELAAEQDQETARFKSDVRKLKALGLTISLEVGYRLSPRGRIVLDALRTSDAAD